MATRYKIRRNPRTKKYVVIRKTRNKTRIVKNFNSLAAARRWIRGRRRT